MPDSLRLAAAAHRAATEYSFRQRFSLPANGSACVVDPDEVRNAYHASPGIDGAFLVDRCTRGDERRRSLALIPTNLHALYEQVRADERFTNITLCVKSRPGKGNEGLLVAQAKDEKHYLVAAWDQAGTDCWQLPPAPAPLS